MNTHQDTQRPGGSVRPARSTYYIPMIPEFFKNLREFKKFLESQEYSREFKMNYFFDLLNMRMMSWERKHDSRGKKESIKSIENLINLFQTEINSKSYENFSFVDIKNLFKYTKPIQLLVSARKRRREDYDTMRQIQKYNSIIDNLHEENIEDLTLEERLMYVNDKNSCFTIPSSYHLEKIYKEFEDNFNERELEQFCCCVCEMLHFKRNVDLYELSEKLLQAFTIKLQIPGDLPELLRSYYDCSIFDSRLSNIALCKEGFHISEDTDFGYKMCICSSCYASLSNKRTKSPPKLAIANGFYIGLLPEALFNSTDIEHSLCATVNVAMRSTTMRSGQNAALNSHSICFDAQPGPLITTLPRSFDDLEFKVVMAGTFSETQIHKVRKIYEVRVDRLQALLHWYCDPSNMNSLYEEVTVKVHSDILNECNACHDSLFENYSDFDTSAIQNDCDSNANITQLTQVDVIENNSVFVSTNELNAADTVSSLRKKYKTFQAKFSNIISHSAEKDGTLFARVFPQLFPFGRGHPGEKRKSKVGILSCVRKYLLLYHKRFAKNSSFIMFAFNRIALQRTFLSTYVYCKYSEYNDDVANVLEDDIKEYIETFENSSNTCHNKRSYALFKGIGHVSKSMWASSSERKASSHRAFSYMQYFGNPHIFATITPNAAGNATVAYFAGELSKEFFFDTTKSASLPKSTLHEFTSKAPFASALYYDELLNYIFEILIGFDYENKLPRVAGGIFGQVKAFCGATESQGTGNLHLHFLLWLVGLPKTVESTESKLKEEEYCSKASSLFESIICPNLPFPNMPLLCISCYGTDFSYTKMPSVCYGPLSNAFSRPFKFLSCNACGFKMSSPEYNIFQLCCSLDELSRLLPSKDLTEFNQLCTDLLSIDFNRDFSDKLLSILHNNTFLTNLLVNPRPPNFYLWHPKKQSLVLSLIVFMTNLHRWSHNASCFKKSIRTMGSTGKHCRYFFPKDSSVTQEPSLLFRNPTLLGSEYVNPYNKILAFALRCNHDVKFLVGDSSHADSIYYMFKYAWKTQQQADSKGILAITALRKRKMIEQLQNMQGIQSTNQSTARKRISSLTLAITNKQEVAAPMCALYLLRGSPFYFSHDEASLNLRAWFAYFQNNEIACSLSKDALSDDEHDLQTYSLRSSILNYIYRPSLLEEVNLYVFTSKYSECKLSIETELPDNKYNFKKDHPSFATKGLVLNCPAKVPNIHGCTIPNRDKLETLEETELYGKVVLTLFKPFRALKDLKFEDDSWYETYSASVFDEYALEIIANIQNYYQIQNKAQESLMNAKNEIHRDTETVEPEIDVSMNIPDGQILDNESTGEISNDLYIIPFAYSDNSDDFLCPALDIFPLFLTFSDDVKFENPQYQTLFPTSDTSLTETINPTLQYELHVRMCEEHGQSYFIDQWNLNVEQATAFVMYTNALRNSWNNVSQEPLLAYLGGQGGTGKSQIIKCLKSFVSYYEKPNTLIVTAFTGKAAYNIQGVTLHSILSFKNLSKFTTEYSMSFKTKRLLLDTNMIFIDECSMISKNILAKVDSVLQWLTGKSVPYGGVHVILAGDFLQLPPVKCKYSLFTDLSKMRNPSIDEQQGFYLWTKHMKNTIVLTQNYRHKDDPEWAAYCNEARLGNWSDEFIALINTRHIANLECIPLNFQESKYTPIVTPLNSRRYKINLQYVRSIIHKSNFSMKIYRLISKISCKLGTISDSEIPMILSVSDEKFDKLCPMLDVFPGMAVSITHNVNKQEGVVNGSVFFVKSVNFSDATSFSKVFDPFYESFVEIPSTCPESLTLLSCKDHKEVLLFPIISKKWTKIPISYSHFKEIKLSQFPCVCATGSSVYKIQGDTLNSMIVDSWWSNTGADSPQQGYVYISRVTSRYSFITLELLTPDIVCKFKSSSDVIELEKQLLDISKVNVHNATYRPVSFSH